MGELLLIVKCMQRLIVVSKYFVDISVMLVATDQGWEGCWGRGLYNNI